MVRREGDRFVINLRSEEGGEQRRRPRVFSVEELRQAEGFVKDLQENEFLSLSDPEFPGQRILLRLSSRGDVFRERISETAATARGWAGRTYLAQDVARWYLQEKDTARKEKVYAGEDVRFEIKRRPQVNAQEVENGVAGKERALEHLLGGEFVSVFEPKEGRRVRLQKMSNGRDSQFCQTGNNNLALRPGDFRAQVGFNLYSYTEVLDLLRAQPAVVDFEEVPFIREQERLRVEQLKQFDRLPIGGVVVLGERMFKLEPRGEFKLTSMAPQTRESGTKMLGKGRFTRSVVRSYIEEAYSPDAVSFFEEKPEGLLVRESDEKLRLIHEQFAKIVPDLYGDVVKETSVERARKFFKVGNVQTARDKVLQYYKTESHIEQGGIGVCYALGGVHALKRTHPEVYFDMVARTIRKEGDVWKVRFLGYEELPDDARTHFNRTYPDGWISVTQKDIEDWKAGVQAGDEVKTASKADLPDIILERAYLSYRSFFEYGEPGKTFIANAKGDIAAEGGFAHRALFDILGPLAEKWKIAHYNRDDAYVSLDKNGYADDAVDFFSQDYVSSDGEYIVTANMPAYVKGAVKANKYIEYTEPGTGKIHRLSKKHAYAVLGIRQSGQYGLQIHLANPHDTRKKQFWMNLNDFTATFSQVSYVRLLADFRKKDPVAAKILRECYSN